MNSKFMYRDAIKIRNISADASCVSQRVKVFRMYNVVL